MVPTTLGDWAKSLKLVPEIGVRLDALTISADTAPTRFVIALYTTPVAVQVVGVIEIDETSKYSFPLITSLTYRLLATTPKT